jgi:hypothetical protein
MRLLVSTADEDTLWEFDTDTTAPSRKNTITFDQSEERVRTVHPTDPERLILLANNSATLFT